MTSKERKAKIDKLRKQLEKLEDGCKHPKSRVSSKNKGSSGNWDPSDDKSWTEFTCHVCGHFWTEDCE